jgi:hypothetical protein
MRRYVLPGAILAAGLSVGVVAAGILNTSESEVLPSEASLPSSSKSPLAEQPNITEGPNPYILDTGVLTAIIRDFAPLPGATLPPDADKWSEVLCESDAKVYLDENGAVTQVESKGGRVQIEVGEKVTSDVSFKDVPYMTHAVYRDGDGKLLLGYKYCKNEEGEIQVIASSTAVPGSD